MQMIELLLLAIGLSMDAFAVSICKGLAMKKVRADRALLVGLWFGGFQALMPSIGYFLGSRFLHKIEDYDHWVAFILLTLIGLNMIRESVFGGDDEEDDGNFGFVTMLMLAIATSIDALIVGITIVILKVNIVVAAGTIGMTTFCISVAGVLLGTWFGKRFKKGAELVGGVILIGIGLRVLLTSIF